MKRWLRVSFSLLVPFILLFSLGACSKKEGLKTVRVAEVTRSVFYTPQYVAIQKGFFKDEGLKIDLKTTAGGDKTMTTLLSDGADIALVGSENLHLRPCSRQ